MKFKLGLAAGMAIGYWLGQTPADERRAKLDGMLSGIRDNPRVQRLTETVTTDARRLGDAVEDRVVRTAGGAVDAVTGTVEAGDEEESGGSSSQKSGSSSRKSA